MRRYGDHPLIFLEQKRKSKGKVAKRRVEIQATDLDRLRETPTDLDWAGHWFQSRLQRRNLEPMCQISYLRQAYFGQNVEGPLRLTLDRAVHGNGASGWTIGAIDGAKPLVTSEVLLELKYRKNLPALFKTLMQDFGLLPGSVSKYRLAVETLGLRPARVALILPSVASEEPGAAGN